MSETKEPSPSTRDALTGRRLYLLNLVELIEGNHQPLTTTERLSITAIAAEVKRIENQLRPR